METCESWRVQRSGKSTCLYRRREYFYDGDIYCYCLDWIQAHSSLEWRRLSKLLQQQWWWWRDIDRRWWSGVPWWMQWYCWIYELHVQWLQCNRYVEFWERNIWIWHWDIFNPFWSIVSAALHDCTVNLAMHDVWKPRVATLCKSSCFT